jgi:hypothetical protein
VSNDKTKDAARQRMARTGESYTAARRAVIAEHARPVGEWRHNDDERRWELDFFYDEAAMRQVTVTYVTDEFIEKAASPERAALYVQERLGTVPPPLAAHLSRLYYLLVCRECGDPDQSLAMPFDSAAARGEWASGHTAATGHDRWFATETTGRLSTEDLAAMIAQSDTVLRGIVRP